MRLNVVNSNIISILNPCTVVNSVYCITELDDRTCEDVGLVRKYIW